MKISVPLKKNEKMTTMLFLGMQNDSETTGFFFKGLDSRKSIRKMIKDKITIKNVMVFDDAARGRS